MTRQVQECRVCGDRAYYVFYGAVACDSCRTFFRRQVSCTKGLSCHFGRKCQIQLNTRKDCSSCRFEKCLAVGMKESSVSFNEEGIARRKNGPQQPPEQDAAAAADDVLLPRASCPDPRAFAPSANLPHSAHQAALAEVLAAGLWVDVMRVPSTVPPHYDSLLRDVVSGLSYSNQLPRSQARMPDPNRRLIQDSYPSHVERHVRMISRTPVFPGESSPDISLDALPSSLTASSAGHQLLRRHGERLKVKRSVTCTMTRAESHSQLPSTLYGHPDLASKRKRDDEPNLVLEQMSPPDSDCSQSLARDLSPQVVDLSIASQGDPAPASLHKNQAPSLTINLTRDLAKAQMIEISGLSSKHRLRFIQIIEATQGIENLVLAMIRAKRFTSSRISFLPILVNVGAEAMRTIVGRLAFYGDLTSHDKRCLLLGSLTDILFLRSARFFNLPTSAWIFDSIVPQELVPGIVPIHVLRFADEDLYDKYSQFVATFDPAVYDDVVCNLLCIICYLAEREYPLWNQDHIRRERLLYWDLLKRYVAAKFLGRSPSHEAVFIQIKEKMDELARLKVVFERSDVDLHNLDHLVLRCQTSSLDSPPFPPTSLWEAASRYGVPNVRFPSRSVTTRS